MNTLTVRDVGTFGGNYGRNRGFGRYGIGNDADPNGTGTGTGTGTGNGIMEMITEKKIMGIPVWMLGAGAVGAWFFLRK